MASVADVGYSSLPRCALFINSLFRSSYLLKSDRFKNTIALWFLIRLPYHIMATPVIYYVVMTQPLLSIMPSGDASSDNKYSLFFYFFVLMGK